MGSEYLSLKERDHKLYEASVRDIYVSRLPILPDGIMMSTKDADRYTKMKASLQDRAFEIITPTLTDKEKLDVIARIEDEFDDFIRNNHKSDD